MQAPREIPALMFSPPFGQQNAFCHRAFIVPDGSECCGDHGEDRGAIDAESTKNVATLIEVEGCASFVGCASLFFPLGPRAPSCGPTLETQGTLLIGLGYT